ncbi:MAG TPA: adenylosuccinate synthase [Anaerohalosphaeraceae bacterium]|nr:adenylosuccinate synthase [Anaerohalosphaeraceae bacterium]HOL88782.1 adenylosuccinate synthase [Anaerohalosphaeraceae bacterium]HPP55967.1 adenylosuccinate synthase [Anaerohalosphaeraceae bacterium]
MNCCIAGLQWGDEGKGKVVDILAEQSDCVVRYNGGANAGHTVIIGDQRFALHLLPSGAVRPGCRCVIANGVVVDPAVLMEEIRGLQERGISLQGRLFISENAHVVLDYHKLEDRLREEALGKNKIGTTARGIGPCYADKVGRSYAVRMADFRRPEELKEKLRKIISYKNKLFSTLYNAPPLDADAVFEKCMSWRAAVLPCITNTTQLLFEAIDKRQSILFEGAQGSLLDLDHGTFPYVTSSNASPLGLGPGCGIPARYVDRFIGVAKAYSTRVGGGPFPTEQNNEIGQYIREKGHEYGTTTGRPRRCGWFDAVAVSYTVRLGGITEAAMMHLDTLAGLEEVKICRAYRIDGREITFFPGDSRDLETAECVYETMEGWKEDLSEMKHYSDLPASARRYVETVEKHIGIPITMLGVGPQRSQVIYRKPL